jgi:hypothetical protein
MSFIKFTGSVVVPKTVVIACAAINSFNVLGFSVDLFVTSGNDGVHMRGSKHYDNEALDFRTKNLSKSDKHLFKTTLKGRLGKGYDLVLEDEDGPNEHLHVEWDPEGKG